MKLKDFHNTCIDGVDFVIVLEYDEIENKPEINITNEDLDGCIISDFSYYDDTNERVFSFSGISNKIQLYYIMNDYIKISNISYDESMLHNIVPKWFIHIYKEPSIDAKLWYGSTGEHRVIDEHKHYIKFIDNEGKL